MRSDVVRGGWVRAGVVAAMLVLLSGCARPQGIHTVTTLQPSPTPFVRHDPLTIANFSLHAGEVGVNYTPVTLSATGGVAPLHWSISVGSLPGGLDLSADGIVSGTPTANGFFAFSVQVFDSGNSTAGVPSNIPITPRLTAGLIPACATFCAVEQGCVTVCGTFGSMSGGVAPFKFTSTGNIPPGETLNQLSLAGTFPSVAKFWQFTVTVTDAFGVAATITPTFNVFAHISLSGSALCQGSYVTACSVRIPYTGGTPSGQPGVSIVQVGAYCPPGYAVCPPAPSGPPGGFSATASNGSVVVSVAAACGRSCPNGYTGAITLRLTDQSLCSAGTNCTSGTAVIDVYMIAG